jgi:C-3',4' desaturase CrtD
MTDQQTDHANDRYRDQQADVTVIGAGFAGLTAAALLAREGFRVQVLERDVHAGGCAAAFSRQTSVGSFRFAVGATLAAGMEHGGLLARIFAQLGRKPQSHPLDPVMQVHLNRDASGGLSLPINGSRAGWQDTLARFGDYHRHEGFWREIQGIADAMHQVAGGFPVLPLTNLDDLWDSARAIRPGLWNILAALYQTVGGAAARHGLRNPAHHALLDGQLLDSMQTTSQHCALPNGAYALEVYRFGGQYIPGGLASLAEALAASLLASGGRLHYATRARSIVAEAGRVVGVQAGKRFFRSPVVISTAPLSDSADLLGGACPPALRRRSDRLPALWGAFTLYIAIDERALPAGLGCFEQVIDFEAEGEHYRGLANNFLVSISPAWDQRRAPMGYRAITVSTHVRPEGWFGQARPAYQAQKAAFAQTILARLEALWPGFGRGIISLEAGTPRTFASYTLHSLGRVGGIPQTPLNTNFHAQHHRSGLDGLLLAGETIFPGQGTLGVALSGYNAYRSAKRYLLRQNQRGGWRRNSGSPSKITTPTPNTTTTEITTEPITEKTTDFATNNTTLDTFLITTITSSITTPSKPGRVTP